MMQTWAQGRPRSRGAPHSSGLPKIQPHVIAAAAIMIGESGLNRPPPNRLGPTDTSAPPSIPSTIERIQLGRGSMSESVKAMMSPRADATPAFFIA